MIKIIQKLGYSTLELVTNIGLASIFLFNSIWAIPNFKKSFPIFIKQVYFLGVLSLLIIGLSGLFIGMVLGLQGYTILIDFGSEAQVGQLVALTLLRELSPVVSAILFAGRAGSATTAEIGLMKATEQISSLEMMGIDPFHRIIGPRFWAGVFSVPVLSIIFSIVGIWGGAAIVVELLGVSDGLYWGNMIAVVDWQEDIVSSIIKSVVFAILVIWVALYQGFYCYPTAEGISSATTKTVVFSSLLVLCFDFLLTALLF